MLRRFAHRHPSCGAIAIATSATAVRTQATVPTRRPLHVFDSCLSGSSAAYIEELYLKFKKDPASVDASWQEVFGTSDLLDFEAPVITKPIHVIADAEGNTVGETVSQSLADCARLTWMILAFEERGHLLARTNPLEENEAITERNRTRNYTPPSLALESFGFKEEEFDRIVKVGFQKDVGGLLDTSTPPMSIRELHSTLTKLYCGHVGFEVAHIENEAQVRYLRDTIESSRDVNDPLHRVINREEKEWILNELGSAVQFEGYFQVKHAQAKRFGLDGGESLIVALKALINRSAALGVEDVILGMAHRGRLNVLHHLCGKPFPVILKEFLGVNGDELLPYKLQSDVKYHLGYKSPLKTRAGGAVTVEMLPNPSHLEAVNPFVQGKTRGTQRLRGVDGKKKVLPIELHGDAAFSGQGVVFETMCISEVEEYHTGGTIHVVVNNQIGFTTDPKCSRSSKYCTDLGRTFQCPIFHVNGDKPEDVVRVFELAANFRSQFNKSVVIDLVCYRRNGHNESDDATMTQPVMYKLIKNTKNIFDRYAEALVQAKEVSQDFVTSKANAWKAHYRTEAGKSSEVNYSNFIRSNIPETWKNMKYSDSTASFTGSTAVTQAQLDPVIAALNKLPEKFNIHPKIKAIFERRHKGLQGGSAEGVDWGAAEALAFGTLVNAGVHVRVSGQDVERATFSQRHAVVHDQETAAKYTQLQHISPTQAPFSITNSPLSEYGVLGFDAGYALVDPNQFVMWEAQFGDFANGASIIFDQFLSAAETKWNQQHSVVVSLPHGYDGNGPEHSSGRLERFLQSVAEDPEAPALSIAERHQAVNMEVTYPTTPAQYFHLIRRHVSRDFRKPWINFFSKQFLRSPVSQISELTSGEFQPVIGDASVPASKARRLILCTGQIYHIINNERVKSGRGAEDVAIVRIEQLAPFPVTEVQAVLEEYAGAELMWAQEEPKNMGAFWHVQARIESYTKRPLLYNGRTVSASPSTGFKYVHEYEQKQIVDAALA